MQISNNHHASQALLIGLDWGTSSLRAYLFAADGAVIDQKAAALGILAVNEGRFDQAWRSLCEDWLARAPSLPVIASGMIGSRQGWREAAYLATPAGFDELAHSLTTLDDIAGRVFRIVPGLTHRNDALPDVMRGEETQVVGLLEPQLNAGPTPGERDARIVLPGTHSKWVRATGHRISAFRSYMTGEVYALMQKQSILARTSAEPGPNDDQAMPRYWQAFDAAVRLAARRAESLLALFFSTRSRGLFGELDAIEQAAWLSGLTIGAELGAELGAESVISPVDAADTNTRHRADTPTDISHPQPILIVGATELSQRYERALRLLGHHAHAVAGEPAARGLFAVAQRAGLINRTTR